MPQRVRPVFKWPGGKFRLLDAILPVLPKGKRLVEPFVGSGALFMNSAYPAYLLCDINPDLIAFFTTLAKRGEDFIKECAALFTVKTNTPETFYKQRDRFNQLPKGDERAALFLYFNRHGYNGLIRYNASGEFNVPFGRYAKPYFPDSEMRVFLARTKTAKVQFMKMDFRKTFAKLKTGDVVYCDPPYIPLSATANFTAYSGNAFGLKEQAELAQQAEQAGSRGIPVVISNHDAGAARQLYERASYKKEVIVRRTISCNGEKREMVKELLAVYT